MDVSLHGSKNISPFAVYLTKCFVPTDGLAWWHTARRKTKSASHQRHRADERHDITEEKAHHCRNERHGWPCYDHVTSGEVGNEKNFTAHKSHRGPFENSPKLFCDKNKVYSPDWRRQGPDSRCDVCALTNPPEHIMSPSVLTNWSVWCETLREWSCVKV